MIDRGLTGAAALRIGRERLFQLVGKAEVIDDQPARLVLEYAIDAGDGLHQPVPAHRLVDIHRVQARRVEPGQPHVAHDDDAERIRRIAEPVRKRLTPQLVADVRLPVRGIGGGTGHHDFDRALIVLFVVPFRAQRDQLAVKVDADAPAHADDHRLAVLWQATNPNARDFRFHTASVDTGHSGQISARAK